MAMQGLLNDPMFALGVGLLGTPTGGGGSLMGGIGRGLAAGMTLSGQQQQRELYREQIRLQNERVRQAEEDRKRKQAAFEAQQKILQQQIGQPGYTLPQGVQGPQTPATGLMATDPTRAALAQASLLGGDARGAIGLLGQPQGPTYQKGQQYRLPNGQIVSSVFDPRQGEVIIADGPPIPVNQFPGLKPYPGPQQATPVNRDLYHWIGEEDGKQVNIPVQVHPRTGNVFELNPDTGQFDRRFNRQGGQLLEPAARLATGTAEEVGLKLPTSMTGPIAQAEVRDPVVTEMAGRLKQLLTESPGAAGGVANWLQTTGSTVRQVGNLLKSKYLQRLGSAIKPENRAELVSLGTAYVEATKRIFTAETRMTDRDMDRLLRASQILETATDDEASLEALQVVEDLRTKYLGADRALLPPGTNVRPAPGGLIDVPPNPVYDQFLPPKGP